MKIILHIVSPDAAILALRAAKLMWLTDNMEPGDTRLVEFENGQKFQVNRNQHSYSVWSSA